MPNRICLTIAALVAMGAAPGAHTQANGFFGDKGPFLDRADLVLADQAAIRLLRPQPAAIGTTETWAEPTSGDSGTLTMERAYRSKGRDCRTVGWHDVFKSGVERNFHLDTCLVAGRWRLM
jgi:surface antigen